MKIRILLIVIVSCFLTVSCDFNINNGPGPQMSMSINQAKKHGTFICEYKIPGNKINGIEINEIFAEKKFWRTEGWFSKNKVECCRSQLVIISKEPFSTEEAGYDIDWKLTNFQQLGTYLICKNYTITNLPDSIKINIVFSKKSNIWTGEKSFMLRKTGLSPN